MQRARLVLFLLALTASAAAADLRELKLDGTVENAGASRKAHLRVLCEPSAKGALSLELWVPKAFKLKDFDYDDFEGPDAAASSRALSHVEIAGHADTSVEQAGAGWWAGGDPDTFVFAVSQLSKAKSAIAAMLAALADGDTQILWTQRGYDDPKRELRASFALDKTKVDRLRELVAPCLPK